LRRRLDLEAAERRAEAEGRREAERKLTALLTHRQTGSVPSVQRPGATFNSRPPLVAKVVPVTPEPERDWEWPDDPPVTTPSERLAILVIAVLPIVALWAAIVWSAVAVLAWLS